MLRILSLKRKRVEVEVEVEGEQPRRRYSDDPAVDHAMIKELSLEHESEVESHAEHVRVCSLRFKFLSAMGVENNRQSRSNAIALEDMRASLTKLVLGVSGILALVGLFGKDKGGDIVIKLIDLGMELLRKVPG